MDFFVEWCLVKWRVQKAKHWCHYQFNCTSQDDDVLSGTLDLVTWDSSDEIHMLIVVFKCLIIHGTPKEEAANTNILLKSSLASTLSPISLSFVKMPPTSLKSQVLWAQIQQPQGQQENEGITSTLIIWAIEVASVEDSIQTAVYFHVNPSCLSMGEIMKTLMLWNKARVSTVSVHQEIFNVIHGYKSLFKSMNSQVHESVAP